MLASTSMYLKEVGVLKTIFKIAWKLLLNALEKTTGYRKIYEKESNKDQISLSDIRSSICYESMLLSFAYLATSLVLRRLHETKKFGGMDYYKPDGSGVRYYKDGNLEAFWQGP